MKEDKPKNWTPEEGDYKRAYESTRTYARLQKRKQTFKLLRRLFIYAFLIAALAWLLIYLF